MANSRMLIVCKHCGAEYVLASGYHGAYFNTYMGNLHDDINKFFVVHSHGSCADDTDCSDDARNHFIIWEELTDKYIPIPSVEDEDV